MSIGDGDMGETKTEQDRGSYGALRVRELYAKLGDALTMTEEQLSNAVTSTSSRRDLDGGARA